MTTYLTMNTCRRIVKAQEKVITDGIAYRKAARTERRYALTEAVMIARDHYDDSTATADENVRALSACIGLMLDDLRDAEPAKVIPGCNYDGKNPLDSTVIYMWAPTADKPKLTNAAHNDYVAMRDHFAKKGSIVKLAKAWLELDEAKQFKACPKADEPKKDPKFLKELFKLARTEGWTAADVAVAVEAVHNRRNAA